MLFFLALPLRPSCSLILLFLCFVFAESAGVLAAALRQARDSSRPTGFVHGDCLSGVGRCRPVKKKSKPIDRGRPGSRVRAAAHEQMQRSAALCKLIMLWFCCRRSQSRVTFNACQPPLPPPLPSSSAAACPCGRRRRCVARAAPCIPCSRRSIAPTHCTRNVGVTGRPSPVCNNIPKNRVGTNATADSHAAQ